MFSFQFCRYCCCCCQLFFHFLSFIRLLSFAGFLPVDFIDIVFFVLLVAPASQLTLPSLASHTFHYIRRRKLQRRTYIFLSRDSLYFLYFFCFSSIIPFSTKISTHPSLLFLIHTVHVQLKLIGQLCRWLHEKLQRRGRRYGSWWLP